MKCFWKKKVKIDWMIHMIADEKQRDDPEAIIDYVSSGFDKYDYGEITVIGKVKNKLKIGGLINMFGRMLAGGEVFDPDVHHFIDDKHGNKEYEFDVIYGEYNGKDFILLMPDFESDVIKLPVRLFKDLSDRDDETDYDDIQLDDELLITLNGVYFDAVRFDDDFYIVTEDEI